MIIIGRRRTAYGEAPETVVPFEEGGRRVQSAPRQGPLERQLVPTTEWRVCFVIRADVVAVPPADCTVSRVKIVSHFSSSGDPDVGGQQRIERAPQLLNVAPPPLRHPNANRLSSRVHSGVRSARSERRDRRRAQPLENLFQYPLNGALLRLALPPAESGAVVVQYELHIALGHCPKTTGA